MGGLGGWARLYQVGFCCVCLGLGGFWGCGGVGFFGRWGLVLVVGCVYGFGVARSLTLRDIQNHTERKKRRPVDPKRVKKIVDFSWENDLTEALFREHGTRGGKESRGPLRVRQMRLLTTSGKGRCCWHIRRLRWKGGTLIKNQELGSFSQSMRKGNPVAGDSTERSNILWVGHLTNAWGPRIGRGGVGVKSDF